MTCDPRVDSSDSTGRWVAVFDMMDLRQVDRTTVAPTFSDASKRMDQSNQPEQTEILVLFSLRWGRGSVVLELVAGRGSDECSQPSSS